MSMLCCFSLGLGFFPEPVLSHEFMCLSFFLFLLALVGGSKKVKVTKYPYFQYNNRIVRVGIKRC